MKLDRKRLKRNTLTAIHDGKTSIVLIGLIFFLLTALLEVLSMAVNGELSLLKQMLETMAAGETLSYEQLLEEQASSVSGFANVLSIAINIMSIMLGVGFSVAALNTARHRAADIGNLFDGFAFFFRALSVPLLSYFIVVLYSILYVLPVSLVIVPLAGMGEGAVVAAAVICLPLLLPSVMAYYSYRQALYLLIDDPRRNPIDCLRNSKILMKGRKMELFKLDLSFIGWYLLCLIPVAEIWVRPYTETCFAGYYDLLMADYAATHPPVTPEQPTDGPSDNSDNQ